MKKAISVLLTTALCFGLMLQTFAANFLNVTWYAQPAGAGPVAAKWVENADGSIKPEKLEIDGATICWGAVHGNWNANGDAGGGPSKMQGNVVLEVELEVPTSDASWAGVYLAAPLAQGGFEGVLVFLRPTGLEIQSTR